VDLVGGFGTFWLGGEALRGEREKNIGESRIRSKGSPCFFRCHETRTITC